MNVIYEGNISVKAALLSPYQKVHALYVDETKKDRDTLYIVKQAQLQSIEINRITREAIDALAVGTTHGGIVCIGENRMYQSIEDVLQKHSFLAIVEGIEDPFNFAYILRSLYAAGCDAIITSDRNWQNAASVLAKASAGASLYIPHVVSLDFKDTLRTLKEHNIHIVGANRTNNAICLYDYDLTQSLCICIGGEKRGLSKVVREGLDGEVYIPYNADFKNALSAVSATTIVAFEVLRQRTYK